MTDAEIVGYLNKLEDNFPVSEWKIRNIDVWPLIKLELCLCLLSESNNTHFSNTIFKQSLLSKPKKIYHYLKACLSFFHIINGKFDVMIFHHNVARTVKCKDGSYFDYNLDPFTFCLKNNFSILHLDYCVNSNVSNTFKKTYFVNHAIDRHFIMSRLKCLFCKKNYKLEKYSEFLATLPVNIHNKFSITNVLKNVIKLETLRNYFYKILIKTKVKFVIAGCGYGLDTMALFSACDKLDIKCMEVQHGLAAGASHRWYTSWTNLPVGKKYQSLPNIYWVWSKADYETMIKWSEPRHLIIQGGKPFVQIYKELEPFISTKKINLDKNKKTILVSLQPCVIYPEWFISFVKKSSGIYNWIIRTHPNFDNYQENFIRQFSNYNSIYLSTKDSLLENELSIADVHVTNHSCVVVDAIEFMVPSIILDSSYKGLFLKEIEKGNVIVADERCIFENALKTLFTNRNKLFCDEVKNKFDIHNVDTLVRQE